MVMTDAKLVQASVIGAMLIEEKTIGPTLVAVSPEDFLDQPYRRLFLAIRKLFSSNQPTDPLTVLDTVRGESGEDWYELIKSCMDVTPTSANFQEYIGILRRQARLHRVQALGVHLAGDISLEEAEETVAKINAQMVERSNVDSVAPQQILSSFFERQDHKPEYLRWGIPQLDECITRRRGNLLFWPAILLTAKQPLHCLRP